MYRLLLREDAVEAKVFKRGCFKGGDDYIQKREDRL